MIEALQFEFMRNALVAGLLASIVCGMIGTLIVVNRIVFLSGGIAHAAYGGIGIAFFFGWPHMVGTIGFSLIIAMIMAVITIKTRHGQIPSSASCGRWGWHWALFFWISPRAIMSTS